MADAKPPFRPRSLEGEGRSADDVLGQLARLRRRVNVVAAQEALYSTAAFALLAVSTVVVLAFALSPGWYGVAVWVVTALLLLTAAAKARALRHEWLPRRGAAVAVDRRAHLEERLATLVALAPAPGGSRLWSVLVKDNLRRLPEWSPQRMAPRLLPGSFWLALLLLLGTVALLQLSSILPGEGGVFPRLVPRDAPADLALLPPPEGVPPPEESREMQNGTGLMDLSSILNSLPAKLRDEILRRAKRMPPGMKPPPGAKPIAGGGARGSSASGSPPDGRGEKSPSDRQPLAASPDGAAGDKALEAPELAERGRQGRDKADGKLLPPVRGEGLKTLPRAGTPSKEDRGKAASQLAGSGAGAGAGSGPAQGELYGAKEPGGDADGSFQLDLDGKAEPSGDQGGSEGDPSRPAGALAKDQEIDDAVRRAQVPPEYEAIVKRIFRRDESPAAAGN
ncbi:MAG: hypothetical protein QOD06_145 [Candidatus Binatota bacterium]|nr:hypothetical protein [Candidatus Binatota bacterium]